MAGKSRSGERQGAAPTIVTEEGQNVYSEPDPATGDTLSVRYEYGNDFRIVPIHGVFGSIAGDGDIFIAGWYQHPAMPTNGQLEITSTGIREKPGEDSKTIVRRIELGLNLSADVAESLMRLLQRQLQKVDEVNQAYAEGQHVGTSDSNE